MSSRVSYIAEHRRRMEDFYIACVKACSNDSGMDQVHNAEDYTRAFTKIREGPGDSSERALNAFFTRMWLGVSRTRRVEEVSRDEALTPWLMLQAIITKIHLQIAKMPKNNPIITSVQITEFQLGVIAPM